MAVVQASSLLNTHAVRLSMHRNQGAHVRKGSKSDIGFRWEADDAWRT